MNIKTLIYICLALGVCISCFFFSSCENDTGNSKSINRDYFVGAWNIKQTNHWFCLASGDSLIQHAFTDELVYQFAEDGTLTITYDEELIWRDSWQYDEHDWLTMSFLDDERVLFNGTGMWRVNKISDSKFVAVTEYGVQENIITGYIIQKYEYTFEKR